MAQLTTFDTHQYIKELTASGFDEKQAEIIIKSILKGRDYDVSNLATKEQLIKTEVKLEKQIIAIKEQLIKTDNRITTLDNKIIILDNKIEDTKKELKKDIELNKSQLETKIEKSKNTIVMWMISLMFAIGLMLLRIMFMQG